MPEILNTIGQTIDDIVNSQAVQITGRLIFIYLVVLWIASAYWAYRDMQQRSDNAILPYLVAAGIILFTPFLFFLAVWVYKIIRPHEKVGEVWERNLAEEALLNEVEAVPQPLDEAVQERELEVHEPLAGLPRAQVQDAHADPPWRGRSLHPARPGVRALQRARRGWMRGGAHAPALPVIRRRSRLLSGVQGALRTSRRVSRYRLQAR